jgi:cation:H+ antiporter
LRPFLSDFEFLIKTLFFFKHNYQLLEVLGYIALFIFSIGILVKASDWFVDSAEEIGLSFGISPFIIGVTIVAFGTSLPELAASIAAVLAGDTEIVIGNVVGSNVANICLVLGLVAVLSKSVRMDTRVIDLDVPILFASTFLLYFVLQDQKVVWWEGIFLLIGLVIFLANSFGPTESTGNPDEDEDKNTAVRPQTYGMLLLGGVLVWLSATMVIQAIQFLSEYAGISSEIIAVTFVAIGTSLPEVVVSITAARKGNAAMAIGNVLGSNIFNTFAVMGIPALISTLVIPDSIMSFSMPFMIVITLLFTVITITSKITRWEGYIFLLLYAYFMTQLVVDTMQKMSLAG